MQGNEQSSPNRFADEADKKSAGMAAELLLFLRHNKKWWLAPILIMLLLVGALVIVAGTVWAPLIYPFF